MSIRRSPVLKSCDVSSWSSSLKPSGSWNGIFRFIELDVVRASAGYLTPVEDSRGDSMVAVLAVLTHWPRSILTSTLPFSGAACIIRRPGRRVARRWASLSGPAS